jgi:hypothetical protein
MKIIQQATTRISFPTQEHNTQHIQFCTAAPVKSVTETGETSGIFKVPH